MKRFIAFIMVLTLLICAIPYTIYDVNDLAIMKDYFLGKSDLNTLQRFKYDFNGDGKISLTDYIQIKKQITEGLK